VCYPDKLSPTGEASQNLTVNPTQVKRKRGGQKGNRNACKHGFYSATSRLPRCPSPMTRREGRHLGFGTRALFVIWTLAFELYLSFASMRQSASPRLAKINGNRTKRIVRTLTTKRQSASPRLAKVDGNPTKRIVRILTAKSAAGSHLTYEKELLNSGKNSHFYKTNHPGFPRALPSHDPSNSILRIYARNEIMVQFPLLLFAN